MKLIDRDTAEAVDALLVLARTGPASFRKIAARAQARSDRLRTILEKLHRSGIVRTSPGSDKCFAVASPEQEITLLDIVRSIQGTVGIGSPQADAEEDSFGQTRSGLPPDIRQDINRLLEEITLRELLENVSSGLRE